MNNTLVPNGITSGALGCLSFERVCPSFLSVSSLSHTIYVTIYTPFNFSFYHSRYALDEQDRAACHRLTRSDVDASRILRHIFTTGSSRSGCTALVEDFSRQLSSNFDRFRA